MIVFEMELPQFTQADVIEVTGATEKQLQNWVSRGLLKLKESRPGRAQRRLYSGTDIVRLNVMQRLTGLGVSAAFAADFADRVMCARIKEQQEERAKELETGEEIYGTLWTARIIEEDGEPVVQVYKGVHGILAKGVSGLWPDPQVYIEIEVDRIIYDVKHGLLEILTREEEAGEEGDSD